jgi:hypothetical protein
MPQQVQIQRPPKHVPLLGISLEAIGVLMILVEGISAFFNNTVLVPSLGSPLDASYALMALGLASIVALYMIQENPVPISYAIIVAAVLSILFGGGFYYVGAIVAFAGAVTILIHLRR